MYLHMINSKANNKRKKKTNFKNFAVFILKGKRKRIFLTIPCQATTNVTPQHEQQPQQRPRRHLKHKRQLNSLQLLAHRQSPHAVRQAQEHTESTRLLGRKQCGSARAQRTHRQNKTESVPEPGLVSRRKWRRKSSSSLSRPRKVKI